MIDGRKARKAWHSAARPARPARRISLFRGHFPPLQAAFGHVTIPKFVIPIPNQSAIFAGFAEDSSTYCLYAFVAFFLAALISSLI
jgi:hypothetical protein